MPIRKKKISDLTLADSLKGLYTIGYKVVDGVKTSVKVGLEYIQVAYEDVVKATQDAIAAAKTALDAATSADASRKAIEANEVERENNEDARKASEQERSASEIQRSVAETERASAEETRVSEFAKIKKDAYNLVKAVVYRRTNSTNVAIPTGGSFENPYPDEVEWTREIPEGLGRLWVSMRTFTSNGTNQDAAWSTPAAMTYNMYTEYKTSILEDNPGTPDTNPDNWQNEFVNGYIWVASQLVYNGTKKGWVVVRVTPDMRDIYADIANKIAASEVATNAANVATASANQATIGANQSAENADAKAQTAQEAATNANDTANHPTYIGTDHYVYKWNKTTKAYDKTDIYCKGDAFSIKKVYASVTALNADVNNTEIAEGDFVLVNTEDVENPDNAKLYVKTKSDAGVYSYEFLVDMSGAIGFTGKTPQFSMGNISTLEAGSVATATVSEDGTDSDGNPKYKINFAIPRGNPGAPFRVAGEYATIEVLQAAVPDGSSVDGFMAIGTKAPFEYYAWVNGAWMNQGQIAGGGGNVVNIPIEVMSLTDHSTSAEILNAFGGKDAFMEICQKVLTDNAVCSIANSPNGQEPKIIYATAMAMASYTDVNNAQLVLAIISETIMQFMVTVANGVAAVLSHSSLIVTEASSNGKTYGRKDGDWAEVLSPQVLDISHWYDEYTLTDDEYNQLITWAKTGNSVKYGGNCYPVTYKIETNYITLQLMSIEGGSSQGIITPNAGYKFRVDLTTKRQSLEGDGASINLIIAGAGSSALMDDGNYKQVVQSDDVAKVKKLTQTEYDALTTKDSSTLYIIID